MSLFEIGMLVCFGASWPFAIHKTYTSKSARGKSFVFLALIFTGYVLGILHKCLHAGVDAVLLLWMLNSLMVATDLALALHYRRREQTI